MVSRYFRRIRQLVSLAVLCLIGFCFLDLYGLVSPEAIRGILFFQFMPALTNFFTHGAGLFSLAVVLGLTLFAGRLYCSFLCPLGASMDLVIGLGSGKKRRRRTTPPSRLALTLKTITRLVFLCLGLYAIDTLDPFGIFGRFTTVLARPLVVSANNVASGLFESRD